MREISSDGKKLGGKGKLMWIKARENWVELCARSNSLHWRARPLMIRWYWISTLRCDVSISEEWVECVCKHHSRFLACERKSIRIYKYFFLKSTQTSSRFAHEKYHCEARRQSDKIDEIELFHIFIQFACCSLLWASTGNTFGMQRWSEIYLKCEKFPIVRGKGKNNRERAEIQTFSHPLALSPASIIKLSFFSTLSSSFSCKSKRIEGIPHSNEISRR